MKPYMKSSKDKIDQEARSVSSERQFGIISGCQSLAKIRQSFSIGTAGVGLQIQVVRIHSSPRKIY